VTTDGTQYYWHITCLNTSSGLCSTGGIWTFVYQGTRNSWFQTKDGDIYAAGNVGAKIVDCAPSCTGCKSLLSLDNTAGYPGLISRIGAIDLTEDRYSSQKWNTQKSNLGPRIDFDYLVGKLGVNKAQSFCPNGGVCDLPAVSGIYYHGPLPVELNGSNITGKIIIFSDGPVRVKGNIKVDKSSGFFALITKGDPVTHKGITFANTITDIDGDSIVDEQGFYLTNEIIETEAGNPQTEKFFGKGSFIGWGGIKLGRTMTNSENLCFPAETFESYPELFVNAPKGFLSSYSWFWEEKP
jgi:hypothetical protein